MPGNFLQRYVSGFQKMLCGIDSHGSEQVPEGIAGVLYDQPFCLSLRKIQLLCKVA